MIPRARNGTSSDDRSETDAVLQTLSLPVRMKRVGGKTGHVAFSPSLSLSHTRTTRPISHYSSRFFATMLAFSTVPSFRFHAVGYRVENEKFVSLDSVQKRSEADDNFKFTEFVFIEIILHPSIF